MVSRLRCCRSGAAGPGVIGGHCKPDAELSWVRGGVLGRPAAVFKASCKLFIVVAFWMVALVIGAVERVEDARRVARVETSGVLLVLGAQSTVRERAVGDVAKCT